MIAEWYYSHNDNKLGPFSDRQLKELATSGQILPTDTIWKKGIERSVLARKVRNLFAAEAAASQATEPVIVAKPSPIPQVHTDAIQLENITSANLSETLMLGQSDLSAKDRKSAIVVAERMGPTQPESLSIPNNLELRPFEEVPQAPPSTGWQSKPAGRARAIAVKGAIIVGQDGTNVQFRKKCTTCGYEDNCRSRMPIKTGSTKVGFYCTKCRKRRDVEILGFAN